MQVAGKVVVVTGGGNGIGKAMCEAFHRAGAAKVVVVDLDHAAAEAVATSIGGAAFKCDVGQEKNILHVIEETEKMFGPIALFCSNAGIGGGFDPMSVNAGGASDEPWARSWAIHVMAHVYAARHLIPRMKTRGGGYFLNTISAAGLLSQVGSPAYSTTKHAAVGFGLVDGRRRIILLFKQFVPQALGVKGGHVHHGPHLRLRTLVGQEV